MEKIKKMFKSGFVPKGKDNKQNKSKNKAVTTKNAKYVFINESKLDNHFTNVKKSFVKIKNSIQEKISNIMPKYTDNKNLSWVHTFKPQIVHAACIAVSSLVLLTGFAVFDATFSENDISQFYSAKSYTIFLNNEQVGVVRNKETLDNVVQKIQTELESKYRSNINLVGDIEVVESNSTDSALTAENDLYMKMRSMIDFKSQAYAIVVNGKQIGAVNSQQEAQQVIDKVEEYFTKDYNKEDILAVEMAEEVEVNEVNVNFDEIMSVDDLFNYIIIGTNEKVLYTVQDGDTYWDIAVRNSMTVEQLLAANPDANENKLMPGDELSLVVPTPFINVNIKHTMVAEENIKYESETQYVSYMYSDETKVQQAGTYGVAEVKYVVTEQNGREVSREEISRDVVTNPRTEILLVGTQTPPPKVGVGVFINPVPGAYVSSRYGARGSGWHSGLDLAISSGSNIKAADGGTVTYSGWYSSYGYMIEIDHGGGFTTRYAHCSSLLVSKGDKVYQGQVIGLVGSTGVSTGPHLHFEVRKYGSTLNPSSWIGQAYK